MTDKGKKRLSMLGEQLAGPFAAGRAPIILWRVGAAAILCLALVLRLFGIDKGIWLDEYFSIERATVRAFLPALRHTENPPAYFMLLRSWSWLGDSEPFLRIPSIVCGVATVAVVMWWLRRRSALASLLGGFLCATLPIMLRYSQEIRHYPLLLLLTALSFYFAARVLSEPRDSAGYWGLTVSLALAVATHLVGVMLITTIAAFVAVTPNGLERINRKKAVWTLAIPSMVFVFVYLVLIDHSRPRTVQTWWMPPVSIPYFVTTMDELLGTSRLVESLQGVLLNLPLGSVAEPHLGAALAVFLAAVLFFGNLRDTYPLLIAAAFFVLQMTLYSVAVLPIFLARTVLPALIPFVAFIAVQVASMRARALRTVCSVVLILFGSLFARDWIGGQAWRPFEPWKQVAEFIQGRWQSGATAISFPSYAQKALLYYLPQVPPAATVAIGINADRVTIDRQLAALPVSSEARPLFLVVRFDDSVAKSSDAYRALVEALAARFGEPVYSQRDGLVGLSQYTTHAR